MDQQQQQQQQQFNQRLQRSNEPQWHKDIIIVIIYGIFGGLFHYYSTDPERYSNCQDSSFIDWNKLTMIVLYTLVGVAVLKILLYTCKITQKYPELWSALDTIGGIVILICTIGLTATDNTDCGSLHVLAMVFYILVYVSIGIAVLVTCCTCLLCAGLFASAYAAKDDEEYQPINRNQQVDIQNQEL